MYKRIVRDYVRLRRRLYLGEYSNESLAFRGTYMESTNSSSFTACTKRKHFGKNTLERATQE